MGRAVIGPGPRSPGYPARVSISDAVRTWLLRPVLDRLTTLEQIMANVSADLNAVADGINELSTPVSDLLAENRRLQAIVDGVEAEDVEESAAAGRVREAFENLRGKFDAPELPDVAPLPDAPIVVDGATAEGSVPPAGAADDGDLSAPDDPFGDDTTAAGNDTRLA